MTSPHAIDAHAASSSALATGIATATAERTPVPTTVLMCSPRYFDVLYAINPWMDPTVPTDTALAVEQWNELRNTYTDLGIVVHEIDPVEGLPDMVYAANGATVVDSIAYTASFRFPERQPEGDAYAAWLRDHGFRVVEATAVNEGEGDFLVVGDVILAGTGFRSTLASHRELAEVFNREVVTLVLARPEYYHLDTALAVLDARPGHEQIAYLPSAFSPDARAELERRYPNAIIVDEDEAAMLGLNIVSNGRDVIMPARAERFAEALRERGFNPVGVNLSELLKGGGGVKCCTLALRFSENEGD
ncbi:dimethylargininase [Demequina sp.]|uniref:dimethylargininase n=1 Tax=Demequina sp. TaxID=2050685 RepID=UPI003D0D0DD3